MKKILAIYKAPAVHWVGNGFPVRSMFSYQTHGTEISPFLLLDYAGPAHFEKTAQVAGVGQHPHRGFETVTIVYSGEIAHRDSTGTGGVIAAGDVQWMTAGAGIIHDEFHSEAFRTSGGLLEMVQLWVNLPAEHKMTSPRYQDIRAGQIPIVELPSNAGNIRLIAGDYDGVVAPAKTFSPLYVWDITLNAGAQTEFELPAGWNTQLLVLSGQICLNHTSRVQSSELVVLDAQGKSISLKSGAGSRLLLLSGAPIDEPIVGYGPFVMNNQQQISQAIEDFQQGKFGQI